MTDALRLGLRPLASLTWGLGLLVVLACGSASVGQDIDATPRPTPQPTRTLTFPEVYTDVTSRNLKMISVLPRDAKPAILDPSYLSAGEAADQFSPDEMVIGVSLNGEHRAYSIPQLSRHEIANDVLGGIPIAVTW